MTGLLHLEGLRPHVYGLRNAHATWGRWPCKDLRKHPCMGRWRFWNSLGCSYIETRRLSGSSPTSNQPVAQSQGSDEAEADENLRAVREEEIAADREEHDDDKENR